MIWVVISMYFTYAFTYDLHMYLHIYIYLHLYLHIHFILMITLACTDAFMYILHYHLIPRQRVPSAWSDMFFLKTSGCIARFCTKRVVRRWDETVMSNLRLLKWGPWISWICDVYIYIYIYLNIYIYTFFKRYMQNHRELFVCLLACLLVCWLCRCKCFLYLHVF